MEKNTNGNKKISLFYHFFDDGGIERVLLNLTKDFIKNGYQVDLVLLEKTGAFISVLSKEVRVVELKKTNQKYFTRLSVLASLIRYLKTEQPILFLSSGVLCNVLSGVARLFLKKNTIPIVGIQHEHLSTVLSYKSTVRRISTLIKIFIGYRLLSHIVAVSNGVARDLESRLFLKNDIVKTIYNPIDIEEIQTKAQQSLPTEYQFFENIPYTVMVGRLHEQKNYPLALEAFKKVSTQRPELHLVILGQGSEEEVIKKQIEYLGLQEKVHLLGFQNNPFVFIKYAELFMLSSSWEGFGNVLVESMALGVPVVSTDCPSGPAEILDYGKYGVLVPVNDSDTLAEVIIQTHTSPIDGKILEERAGEFSADAISELYLQLIE